MSSRPKIRSGRSTRRAQVFMAGMLSTRAGAIKVTIRDISERGAHVVGDHQIPGGSRVELQRGAMHVFAQVAWVRGKEAGLSFERALTSAELERCMPAAVVRALKAED